MTQSVALPRSRRITSMPDHLVVGELAPAEGGGQATTGANSEG
jgi:hypothetical protein